MSFVPVAPRQESVICSTKATDFIRQNRAEQGSSLACIYSTETFLRVNGWQRVGQETDIIQSDSIKERTYCMITEVLCLFFFH